MKKFLKMFAIIIIISLIIAIIGIIIEKRDIKFKSKEFGIEITYPYYYTKIKSNNNILKIFDSTNGIEINITAIKTEKTKLTIEEIMERYIVTAQASNYYNNYIINEISSQTIEIDNNKIGKVELLIQGKENFKSIILLMPLEEREITITINGSIEIIDNNIEKINNIIDTIKLYDL